MFSSLHFTRFILCYTYLEISPKNNPYYFVNWISMLTKVASISTSRTRIILAHNSKTDFAAFALIFFCLILVVNIDR